MSTFTDRLERNLDEIARHAAPSPTAWQQIQHRIASQQAEPVAEVVVLPVDQPRTAGRATWLVAVAAVIVIAVGIPLYRSSSFWGVNLISESADAPTDTVERWSVDATGPGTFMTTVMEPGFIVTISDGFISDELEIGDDWSVRLPRLDHPALSQAGVVLVDTDAPSGDDLIESITRRGFTLSTPTEVEVGGIGGRRYDVISGALGLVTSRSGTDARVDLPHEAWRITIIEVGGRVVAILEHAARGTPVETEALHAVTDEIVATIRWLDE